MKIPNFVFIFFVWFETTYAYCDFRDKVENCFKETYGNMSDISSWAYEMAHPLLLTDFTKDYWQPICNAKHKLNNCIGVYEEAHCLNIPDLTEFSFVNNTVLAKFIIATFIETDYLCEKIFKLSYKEYKCVNELLPKLEEACPQKVGSCVTFRAASECIVQTTNKQCGKAVGCFQQKTMLLNLCWRGFSFGCDVCDDISTKNNMIDDLCDDDNDIGTENVEVKNLFN